MPHIAREAAPTFAHGGLTVTGLAAPSRGAAESAVWRLRLAPGTPGTAHSVDREEVFVALAGRALLRTAAGEVELREGDAFVVPAHTEFALSTGAAEPFEALAVLPVGGKACLPGGEPFTPPWAR